MLKRPITAATAAMASKRTSAAKSPRVSKVFIELVVFQLNGQNASHRFELAAMQGRELNQQTLACLE